MDWSVLICFDNNFMFMFMAREHDCSIVLPLKRKPTYTNICCRIISFLGAINYEKFLVVDYKSISEYIVDKYC